MTSTWSHYKTRTYKKKNTVRGRKDNNNNEVRGYKKEKTEKSQSTTCAGVNHLGRRSVLLHRWRQRAGVGVGVGGWWLHIVVAEAAEESAEDAAAPLLLQAAVRLGRW